MDILPSASSAAAVAEGLHPALWRASQVARPHAQGLCSGFAELDAALPGGGWPAGTLTELLLPHPGIGELRLLAPVLARLQAERRSLIWFDPPALPCAWALQALGLDAAQVLVVRSRLALQRQARQGAWPEAGAAPARAHRVAQALPPAADTLWALEQALKSGQVGAVLAWLPARLGADALRRLQLAAQGHDGPAFLLRDDAAALRASPAPLRLALASAGPGALRVALLKRRGPPLAQPLVLALPPVLSAAAEARAQAVLAARASGPEGLRVVAQRQGPTVRAEGRPGAAVRVVGA